MSVDGIILWLMAIFMLLGALDRMAGGRFGLGKQFEEGILAIGSLALSMLGILTLAPVLARLLRPVLVPVYGFLGADPAMFAGTILANDMGGAPLAADRNTLVEPVAGRNWTSPAARAWACSGPFMRTTYSTGRPKFFAKWPRRFSTMEGTLSGGVM